MTSARRKILPSKAQLAKCVADAERQIADSKKDAVQ